jgi:flagellar hook-basal body complex protein FliE
MAITNAIGAAAAGITPVASPASGAAATGDAGAGFATSLDALLSSVESSAGEANSAVAAMASGSGDVHTAMLALHRAEVAMQLTVQVRNKLVQAYQDLMRMPL